MLHLVHLPAPGNSSDAAKQTRYSERAPFHKLTNIMHFHFVGSSPQFATLQSLLLTPDPQGAPAFHALHSQKSDMDLKLEMREWFEMKCKPCYVHAVPPDPCPLLVPLTACPFGLSPYLQWPPSHWNRLQSLPEMLRSDDQESAPAQSTSNHNSKCIFNSTHVFIGPCMGTNYAFKNITGKCCK